MSALIHALYETGCVGVAHYVWRNNGTPKLVALSPQIKASHEVCVCVRMCVCVCECVCVCACVCVCVCIKCS